VDPGHARSSHQVGNPQPDDEGFLPERRRQLDGGIIPEAALELARDRLRRAARDADRVGVAELRPVGLAEAPETLEPVVGHRLDGGRLAVSVDDVGEAAQEGRLPVRRSGPEGSHHRVVERRHARKGPLGIGCLGDPRRALEDVAEQRDERLLVHAVDCVERHWRRAALGARPGREPQAVRADGGSGEANQRPAADPGRGHRLSPFSGTSRSSKA
jgi:hypothetical protein